MKENFSDAQRRVYGRMIALPLAERERVLVRLETASAPQWLYQAALQAHLDARKLEEKEVALKMYVGGHVIYSKKCQTDVSLPEETPQERWNRKWRMINRIYLAFAILLCAYVGWYVSTHINMRSAAITIAIVAPIAYLTFPRNAHRPRMSDFIKPRR